MQLTVDRPQRYAKMRAHTATHLLHMELQKYLTHTKQAGSLVDQDYTRFDFQAKQALTPAQIREIETNINNYIHQAHEVTVTEMSYDDAIAAGAKAFFQDKYGDTVRVVAIADTASIELCGGTHVTNTREIGCFKIISQEAVAAGIKRITALTGPKVLEHMHTTETQLQTMANQLKVTPAQLANKFTKTLADYQSLSDQVTALQTKLLDGELTKLTKESSSNDIFDYIIDLPDTLLNINFKTIATKAKVLFEHKNTLLRTSSGQYSLIMLRGDHDAKIFAGTRSLRGGGSNQFFQGKDQKILSLIS